MIIDLGCARQKHLECIALCGRFTLDVFEQKNVYLVTGNCLRDCNL